MGGRAGTNHLALDATFDNAHHFPLATATGIQARVFQEVGVDRAPASTTWPTFRPQTAGTDPDQRSSRPGRPAAAQHSEQRVKKLIERLIVIENPRGLSPSILIVRAIALC